MLAGIIYNHYIARNYMAQCFGTMFVRGLLLLVLVHASLPTEADAINMTVPAGSTARLPCTADTGGNETIYWYFNGTSKENLLVRIFKGEVIQEKENFNMELDDPALRIGIVDEQQNKGVYYCIYVPSPLGGSPITSSVYLDVCTPSIGDATLSIRECSLDFSNSDSDLACDVKVEENVATNLTCQLSNVPSNACLDDISVDWYPQDAYDHDPSNFTKNKHINADGTYNFELTISLNLIYGTQPSVYVCRALYKTPNGTKSMDRAVSIIKGDDTGIDLTKNGLEAWIIVLIVLLPIIGVVVAVAIYLFIAKRRRRRGTQFATRRDLEPNGKDGAMNPLISPNGNDPHPTKDTVMGNVGNAQTKSAAETPNFHQRQHAQEEEEKEEPPAQENGNQPDQAEKTAVENGGNAQTNGPPDQPTIQCDPATVPVTNTKESQTVKDGVILSDMLLITISETIDPTLKPPADLSVFLGFRTGVGNNELFKSHADPKRAYQGLLQKYINKHGTGRDVARNLRDIFKKNEMVPVAEVLEKELSDRKIYL